MDTEKMEAASCWVRRSWCCCGEEEEAEEDRSQAEEEEEEVKLEEVCLRRSRSSLSLPSAQVSAEEEEEEIFLEVSVQNLTGNLCVCVSQPDQSQPPQPHWFHTLQLRQRPGRRARRHSEPRGEEPFSWVWTCHQPLWSSHAPADQCASCLGRNQRCGSELLAPT